MKSLFAVHGPNAAALNLVVAAIQRFAHLSKLREVAGHGIFNKFLWCAAGSGRKLLEARLGFRLEMHYHRTEFRGPELGCQSDSLALIGRFALLAKGPPQAMQQAQSDYRARYCDPVVGRFLNEDPIEFVGGVDFYRYAVNDPVNLEDPTGFNPQSGGDSCNPCANPPAPPGINVAANVVQTQVMNSMPKVGPMDPGILQPAFAAGWWFYMVCCNGSPCPIYDDYNFGATGAALGLPENLLLWGAGVKKYLQLLPHGGTGDPNDSNPLGRYPWGNQKHKSDCIKAGIHKYKNP